MEIIKRVGIQNPFAGQKASFSYEIIKDFGVVNVEYEEFDETLSSYPERTVLLKSLNGESYQSEEFLVTLCISDALKDLRVGELVSVNLRFCVREGADGKLQQQIFGSEFFTLFDYEQICKAEILSKNG